MVLSSMMIGYVALAETLADSGTGQRSPVLWDMSYDAKRWHDLFNEVLRDIWFKECEHLEYKDVASEDLVKLMRTAGEKEDADLASSMSRWTIMELACNGKGVSLEEVINLQKPWWDYWYNTFANSGERRALCAEYETRARADSQLTLQALELCSRNDEPLRFRGDLLSVVCDVMKSIYMKKDQGVPDRPLESPVERKVIVDREEHRKIAAKLSEMLVDTDESMTDWLRCKVLACVLVLIDGDEMLLESLKAGLDKQSSFHGKVKYMRLCSVAPDDERASLLNGFLKDVATNGETKNYPLVFTNDWGSPKKNSVSGVAQGLLLRRKMFNAWERVQDRRKVKTKNEP